MSKHSGRKPSAVASGLWALSPLAVFLCVYLVSSVIAGDFYKIPIAAAFLVSSVWAVLITREPLRRSVDIFSAGAGNPTVLQMIWIFVLAGAFASTAGAIGSVEATVNATLLILPGKLILAGLFLASCFISMSIGTSVGTIVALMPIAGGIAGQADLSLPMISAVIVGGAFFGDNLSFISDTTIAATRSQGCSMSDKFKVNITIAGPAALLVAVIYVVMGLDIDAVPQVGDINVVKLFPYILVIVLALCSVNVMAVLGIGIGLNAAIGFIFGDFGWTGFMEAVGKGIGGMGELIIVTMMAGGVLELIRHGGGLDFLIRVLTKGIRGKRGAEMSIAALVGLSNLCTANNTIAIITTGDIARDISARYGIDPRKSASLLDTFSCVVQGIIPYGAQLLMAGSLAGISSASIIQYLYYPFVLCGVALLSIVFGFPRRFSGKGTAASRG